MNKQDIETSIKTLSDNAGKATESGEAVGFSQAALNLAHTIIVMKEAECFESKTEEEVIAKSVGWVVTEFCAYMDRGGDPRTLEVPHILKTAIKELKGKE